MIKRKGFTLIELMVVIFIVGILAQERGSLSMLQAMRLPNSRTQILVDLTPTDFPENPAALNSLDCLIFNDVDTNSLTPNQKTALQTWVQHGGRLVIGGGSNALRSAEGLPKELLPLNPTDIIKDQTIQ